MLFPSLDPEMHTVASYDLDYLRRYLKLIILSYGIFFLTKLDYSASCIDNDFWISQDKDDIDLIFKSNPGIPFITHIVTRYNILSRLSIMNYSGDFIYSVAMGIGLLVYPNHKGSKIVKMQ